MIRFTVPGEPKAKQRPRLGKGFAYTPKQTVEYENWVKQCYLTSDCSKGFLEHQIHAKIEAYFSIPKSVTKKNRELMLNGEMRPTKKPDADNIAKSILDSLNGIAYLDDSSVVSLEVEKYYSEMPRVEVSLRRVQDDKSRA